MGELTTKEIIEELRKGMPTSDSSDEECERYEKAYNMAIEMLERTKPIDELVVDELEKIKAEIQEEIEDYLMEVDYIRGVKDGFLFSAEIVDKHIAELKGE